MTVTFSSITPSYRHFPDVSYKPGSNGEVVDEELPGQVQFGFDVDGVFVPLVTRMAAGLLSDIAAVKAAQAPPAPTPAAPPPAAGDGDTGDAEGQGDTGDTTPPAA